MTRFTLLGFGVEKRVDLRQLAELVCLNGEDADHQSVLKVLVPDERRRLEAVPDVLGVGEQKRQQIRQLPLLDLSDEPIVETPQLTFARFLVEKIQNAAERSPQIRNTLKRTRRRLSKSMPTTHTTDKPRTFAFVWAGDDYHRNYVALVESSKCCTSGRQRHPVLLTRLSNDKP